MNRHLKYIDGTSDKFWQIQVVDNQFTVTYGKNGTSGVSQTKNFETNELCLKAAEKLLNEKLKKGYSENGEVLIVEKVDAKTGKVSNTKAILEEYDSIIKKRDIRLLLPFLKENTKGNLEAIRKHIKNRKRYWMTYTDLSQDPEYNRKNKKHHWGIRGDEKISEIITLSAIATFNKSEVVTFDEISASLKKSDKDYVLEILQWAKPDWINFYLLERIRKQEWVNFDYRSLRFLEENGLVEYEPELFTRLLSSLNIYEFDNSYKNFENYLSNNTTAYQRDIPQIFNYETNIQWATVWEEKNGKKEEYNGWLRLFKHLVAENKIDRKIVVENIIQIQTKEWNNNLRSLFRKIVEEIDVTADDLIPFQEHIFTYFHNSNPVIINYGSELIKRIYDHPKFKIKSYLEWIEALMIRNDCKTAIKNNLIILDKITKTNSKLNKNVAHLIVDSYINSDLNLQERTTKLLLRIGNEKDSELKEKLANYTPYIHGTIKSLLKNLLDENELTIDENELEAYHFSAKKENVLLEDVVIPNDWNEILFQIGKFISSDEVIDSEIVMNIFISQMNLFPDDYSKQLEPYLKQLTNSYFSGSLKDNLKGFLIHKIYNKNALYLPSNKGNNIRNIDTIQSLINKIALKNKIQSVLPLLSFPTHYPHWIEPKILLERIIQYQNQNEEINMVDFSIAISRMPKERVEQAIPLLDKINEEYRELLSYCLGISNEIKVNSTSIFSILRQNITGSSLSLEKVALWAVASRTYHQNGIFEEFEKTALKEVPFIGAPFIPQVEFKEKWNEWRNYRTKEIERSPSWMELTYKFPEKKTIPLNAIYSSDTSFVSYYMYSEENVVYFNSIMPQNQDALSCALLYSSCKITDDSSSELNSFLNVINHPNIYLSSTSLLVFACCFFKEQKNLRILASEVLINLIDKQAIDTKVFSKKLAYLISNKYGVLNRMIDNIIALTDISPKHNSALFLILNGIFENLKLDDGLPTNFKKLVENYLFVISKTNQKPSVESLQFFEKHKDVNSIKPLVKKIADL